MSCLKIFSSNLQVFVEMFSVVQLVSFIMPMINPLLIAVVVVSYMCVNLSC